IPSFSARHLSHCSATVVRPHLVHWTLSATEAKLEFFLSVAFLINDVERRFHYQYESFQECNQTREAMVKDETGRHLWATCTRGKPRPPSVYQKEFQDQLMPGNFLKERRRKRPT